MTLTGVRVLDLSRLLPGGYCAQLLQAQGARVTKIESPAGDPIRGLPAGEAYFDALHRDQQLLTLDLRTDAGRESLRGCVVDADVLLEGFRPGVMERLELGYASLSGINPALVYCGITGYGSSGPLAHRSGSSVAAAKLIEYAGGRPSRASQRLTPWKISNGPHTSRLCTPG